MKRTQWLIVLAALALGVVGCGDDNRVDGSDAGRDGGGLDSGTDSQVMGDAGDDDGGMEDGGTDDAGDDDGGMTDDGTEDGGTEDGGMTPDGVAAVRAATLGAHSPALEVRGVTVTYVRPAIGDDPAGFFVQAERTGPALFVTAAAGLDPVVAPGDVLDFDVTETADFNGVLHVSMATSFARASTGASLAGLVQDVSSAADLVSAVGDYVSEYVLAMGTLGAFNANSGTGHDAYTFETAGVTGNDSLQLRLAETSVVSLGLGGAAGTGCTVTVGPSPLWRFRNMAGTTDRAQLMGYAAADVVVTDCPDLTVVGAEATDGDTVVVTFSRPVEGAEAGDFALTGGLTVSSIMVSADGTQVTLTLDAAMTPGTSYTVTVTGVNDAADGDAIGTPNTAMFTGFMAAGCPAATGLVINEVDYDMVGADNAEYIELFNASSAAIDLTGYQVVLFNGGVAGNPSYRMVDLSTVGSLPAGGYLIIARPGFTVPTGVALVTFAMATDMIQNGPSDAIAVFNGSNALVDAIAYEHTADTFVVTFNGGMVELVRGSRATPADSNTMEGSIQRIPNACFSGNDAMDWAFGPLSPGVANAL